MEKQTNLQKNLGIFIGAIIACGVLGITIFYANQSSSSSSTASPATVFVSNSTPTIQITPTTNPDSKPVTTQTPTPPVVDTPKKTTSVYKDGTYTATGSYISPGGYDQITVTLTLQNDIITSVSATPIANDGTSRRYQAKFISGYQQYVLGKNIADVNLTTVSGSSLTPRGFDDALAQIKTQAKA